MLSGDAAHAYLTLHDVATDSIVARADTSGTRAEASQLGVQAVGRLLVALMPEETVDVSAIAGRQPEAVQTLLQAERYFHAGRFQQAYDAYCKAVAQDSAFALAAVKGAQAASWLHKGDDAVELIGVALGHPESLAPRDYLFAQGWEDFFAARADSAVRHFEQAIALDSEWPEAWTGLGEVYTHLLPRKTPQDSLAQDAFTRVYERTNHSAPALFHLVEFAVRDRDLPRASRLMGEYRLTDPDTTGYGTKKLEVMLQCADGPLSESDWRDHVLADVDPVLEASRALGVGGAYPDCAIEGHRAVLAHDTSTSGAWRFAASLGLQSMLAATGHVNELRALLDTTSQYRNSLRPHYMIHALAGVPVHVQAEAEAQRLRSDVSGASGWELWFLGVWDAHRDRLDEARALRDTLASRSLGTDGRRASLIAGSLRAHVALAEGDTTRAMQLFDDLSPSAGRGSLYHPWESLGLERLLQAKLFLARGQHSEAFREASTFDSPGAANLILPVFLPASLQIRLEAARELGDQQVAERMELRLSALRR
jgi:tetratricopeptide (TPR) repeat protein